MQKTALTLLVLSTLFTVLGTNVRAQTFDFFRAYQDYQYSLSVYNQSFSDFQDAKDFYLKNPTLTLKEDARKKTLTMLRNRDEMMRVYLTALRMKIVETSGFDESDKNKIFGKIDPEVAWYASHKANYKDDDPLEDLFGKSSESESRYKTNTAPVAYESLFDITLGQEQGLRSSQEAIYKNLRSIIDTQVSAGKLDINPFNRWFTDIEAVIQDLKKDETEGQTQIQKMYGQYYVQPLGIYNTAIGPLDKSVNFLSQLNGFLVEVATSLQNQTQ